MCIMKSIFFAILIVLNLGDVNSSIDWPLADPQVEGKFLSNFVATCTLLFWSPCAMDETTHFFTECGLRYLDRLQHIHGEFQFAGGDESDVIMVSPQCQFFWPMT